MTSSDVRWPATAERFWHEAFFYAGIEEFLAGTGAFIADGLSRDEPVLVVVDADKIGRLRTRFGADAERITFLDMSGVGRNPACIIPAWQDFVDRHTALGQAVRGIGEPVWAGRDAAELLECQLHEALLNLAFDDGPGWALMCPYDTTTLDDATLGEARRSHPHLTDLRGWRPSGEYVGDAPVRFETILPEPPHVTGAISFDADGLVPLRQVVAEHAAIAGLDEPRTAELILAVHEAAANSIRYGGGRGEMRLWQEPSSFVCEIRDTGHIPQPLAGRVRPAVEQEGGRGLWLINQLCDLVQVRSSPEVGTVVRMHVRRPA